MSISLTCIFTLEKKINVKIIRKKARGGEGKKNKEGIVLHLIYKEILRETQRQQQIEIQGQQRKF